MVSNTMCLCAAVEPLPIVSHCASIRFRFVVGEATYLRTLKIDIFEMMGDDLPLPAQDGVVFPGVLWIPLLFPGFS